MLPTSVKLLEAQSRPVRALQGREDCSRAREGYRLFFLLFYFVLFFREPITRRVENLLNFQILKHRDEGVDTPSALAAL